MRRGLLFLDEQSQRYDLHPIVRKNAYEHLTDKPGTHIRLRDYFANVPVPEKVESIEDLNPLIELYHHTVNAGRYNEAYELLRDRLGGTLYYGFGAYQLNIELLLALFPDGENKPPRLKSEAAQAWTFNALSINYALSGQSSRSVPLKERYNKLNEEAGDKKNLSIGLANLALDQIRLGELRAAEANLLHSIKLCREIKDEFGEAVAHLELGRLRVYQGEFMQAEKELVLSTKYHTENNYQQWLGIDELYRSLLSILRGDYTRALEASQKAIDLADVEHYELDIIRAEWLLGAAYRGCGKLTEAETHLDAALARCRKINMVDHEADILLELARLRRDQSVAPFMGPDGGANDGLINQANTLAAETLEIADRSQYRLQQADIHLFLAQLALDEGDKKKARTEAEIAKERASCGYKPALDKAEQFLKELDN